MNPLTDGERLMLEHGIDVATAHARTGAHYATLNETLRATRILEELIADAAGTYAHHDDGNSDAAALARAHARGGTFWLALALARLQGTPLLGADIATNALTDAKARYGKAAA